MFSKLLGLLLGDHLRADATSSKRPTETALAVAVDRHNGVLLMKYLFIMDRTNILIHAGYCLFDLEELTEFHNLFSTNK